MFKPIKIDSVVILVLLFYNVHVIYKKYQDQSKWVKNSWAETKMECLHEALQQNRSDKKNPGFECEK